MTGLHLQNITRHAMRGVYCVRGHRNARAQRRVVRVRDGSHHHVMASWMRVVHCVHDNMRMVDLTTSTELLRRLHVHNITRTEGSWCGLRLIQDGSNAQACETKINVNHNE